MRHWPIKLHDAIQAVLFDRPDVQATTSFIADEINHRRLYVQKGGGPVAPDQVFLRTKNYPQLFRVIDRHTVSLLTQPVSPTPAPSQLRSINPLLPGPPGPALIQPNKRKHRGPATKRNRKVERLKAKQQFLRQREQSLARQRAEERALKATHWRPSPSAPTLPDEI